MRMDFTEESSELANEFIDQLQTAMTDLDRQEIQGSGIILNIHQAAERYIAIMDKYRHLILGFEAILKKQKDMRHQKLKESHIEEYNKYENAKKAFLSSAIPQKIYEESFAFQNLLNSQLNQTVKTVMVIGGELYDVSNLSLEQYLGFGYSSRGKLVGRYGQLISGKVQDIADRLEIKEENAAEVSEVRATYQEAMSRYKYSKSFKRKSKNIIWWTVNKREAIRVSSAGSIDEAYANFRITRETNWVKSRGMEEKIQYFAQEGVLKVTNLSGVLQGDVSFQGTEYAIKGIGASTMGLEQLSRLANQIKAEGQSFSTKDLTQIRDSQKGYEINKVSTFINKTANNLIDEYVSFI